jgi:hypothetical protein
MIRRAYQLATISSSLVFLGSLAYAGQPLVTVQEVNPFSHVVRIPAGADLESIRFERVKEVTVSTRISTKADNRYCQELAFRDPGGSLYCPDVQHEAPSKAYEVTYSYLGQPMTSDESGSKYFTFSVYYRPDEFSPASRELLRTGKAARSDIAAIFNLTTSREAERRPVIDRETSKFCEGSYLDGAWKHTDPQCKDDIKTKMVDALPEYVTVRVEPTSSRVAIAGTR